MYLYLLLDLMKLRFLIFMNGKTVLFPKEYGWSDMGTLLKSFMKESYLAPRWRPSEG